MCMRLAQLTPKLGARQISTRSASDDERSRTAPKRTNPRPRFGMHIAAAALRHGPGRSGRTPGNELHTSGSARCSGGRTFWRRAGRGLALSRRGHLRRIAPARRHHHGHAGDEDRNRRLRCQRRVSIRRPGRRQMDHRHPDANFRAGPRRGDRRAQSARRGVRIETPEPRPDPGQRTDREARCGSAARACSSAGSATAAAPATAREKTGAEQRTNQPTGDSQGTRRKRAERRRTSGAGQREQRGDLAVRHQFSLRQHAFGQQGTVHRRVSSQRKQLGAECAALRAERGSHHEVLV